MFPEYSQLEEHSTNIQRTHLTCSPNIPRTCDNLTRTYIECSKVCVLKMFYDCHICVLKLSSVNVRLMLNNILRQKLDNSSECSQNVLS